MAYLGGTLGEVCIKKYSKTLSDKDSQSVQQIPQPQQPISIKAHQSAVAAMSLADDGSLLATASETGTLIRLFNSETGEQLKELRRGMESVQIVCIAFDSLISQIAISSNKGTVHVFKIELDKVDQSLEQLP